MPEHSNALEHTELKVSLGKIETKVDVINTTMGEIRDHLKIQNGRLSSAELTTAVQAEKIETCEEEIKTHGNTIKANTWKIAILVGAIVGVEKVGTWLLG